VPIPIDAMNLLTEASDSRAYLPMAVIAVRAVAGPLRLLVTISTSLLTVARSGVLFSAALARI
jgi:hypothetical protein